MKPAAILAAGLGIAATASVPVLATALGATGAQPAAGQIEMFSTPALNGGTSTVLITGAIGDYGKSVKINKAGQPDPKGPYSELHLQKAPSLSTAPRSKNGSKPEAPKPNSTPSAARYKDPSPQPNRSSQAQAHTPTPPGRSTSPSPSPSSPQPTQPAQSKANATPVTGQTSVRNRPRCRHHQLQMKTRESGPHAANECQASVSAVARKLRLPCEGQCPQKQQSEPACGVSPGCRIGPGASAGVPADRPSPCRERDSAPLTSQTAAQIEKEQLFHCVGA